MSKVFNAYEKATIKNTAKEVARLVVKQEKLREQIKTVTDNLTAKIKEIDETIAQYEANVQTITGGYAASELCEKVKESWVFKYPATIVPPAEKTETLSEQQEEKEEEKKEEKEEHVSMPESVFEDNSLMPGDPFEEEHESFPDTDDDSFKTDEFFN